MIRHPPRSPLFPYTTLSRSFAGDRSLGDVLREQGTLPLELARRYGDDLLSAVQYLEEAGVTHRDIKPTNVGFTSRSKKQSHLGSGEDTSELQSPCNIRCQLL